MKWLDQFSIFEKILYFIFFPLVALGAIVSPLTNDVRIFLGVEYLDLKYIPNFPSNVAYFWEIKPIFNHIINYILISISCFFIPFQNHFAQEILIKTICVAAAIFACWIFSKNILKIKYSFLLCFIGLFASLNLNIGQAEFWGILLMMVACALFVDDRAWTHYLAGALFIPVILMKGTTTALVVSGVCIVLIFAGTIDWKRGLIGFVSTGLFFLALNLTIWPYMLSDIFISPILSHVGEYNWLGQVYVTLVATAISMSIYIPIIGLGIVYGGIWAKNHIHNSRIWLFILLYGTPLVTLFLQSESFAYQYLLLWPAAITSLVLYERDTPKERPGKKLKRENLIAVTIVILFILWCFLYSPVGKYGTEEKAMNNYFWNESKTIESQFDFENQSVLYMDTGSLPYYTGLNSSCRYVAPLILQRANPNREIIRTLPQYWDQYNCTMKYNGHFILADGPIGPGDSWFGDDTSEKLKIINKIETEYKIVF